MEPLIIQCVYGQSHIQHILNCLIPSLLKTVARPMKLMTINYDPSCQLTIQSGLHGHLEVVDVPNLAIKPSGFAANHNVLFHAANPRDYFVIINPDCIAQHQSIEFLLTRKQKIESKGEKKVGIVEGRQWPYEHPKEYDVLSLETPWASGAFCLIDANFYRGIGGMDDTYFLYVEDVDLSWQAWLNGYSVIYEPKAFVTHFSGGPFYRPDLVYAEQYLSLRNFIVLSKKFFGKKAEAQAIDWLNTFHDQTLAQAAITDYLANFQSLPDSHYVGKKHPKVKIEGINLFHKVRSL